METAVMLVADLKPADYNPRQISDEAIEGLRESVRRFGLVEPIIWNKRTGNVVGGHQRLKILLADEAEETTVVVVDLDAFEEKALNVALNNPRIAGEFSSNIGEILKELAEGDPAGFEALRLADLASDLSVGFLEEPAPPVLPSVPSTEQIEADAQAAIEACDILVVQFSGGKDSTVALNWARAVGQDLGKPVEAIFVETGAEYPDVTTHVIRTCRAWGVPLKVLYPKKSILVHYEEKQLWPDAIFRECLHRFINEPCKTHYAEIEGKVLGVRGGRSDQKVQGGGSNLLNQVAGRKKGTTIDILSPYYNATREEYDAALLELDDFMWPGYKNGFVRTACWMCPFQTVAQWEALKEHYRGLWEDMRRMALAWAWKEHAGDSNLRRFEAYWADEGVPIPRWHKVEA